MSVYLIDVGQGAATLLEFPCGAVLIDSGGEKNPKYDSVPGLHGFLEAFFARRADLGRTLDLVQIQLGDGKHRFLAHTLTAPIYATSWDGTVHLTVSAGGSIRARTSRAR